MPDRFSIDDYFAEARNREEQPLVHQEQIPTLLASTTIRRSARSKATKPTAIRFAPVFGATALLLIALFLLPNVDFSPSADQQIKQQHIVYTEQPMAYNTPSPAQEENTDGGSAEAQPETSPQTTVVSAPVATLASGAPVAQRMITLSQAELRPLGIQASDAGVSYTGWSAPRTADIARRLDITVEQLEDLAERGNIDLKKYIAPVQVTLRTNGIGTKEVEQPDSTPHPVAIPRMASVYTEGKLLAAYWQRSDNALVEAMRRKYGHLRDIAPDSSVARLVPIHFTIENKHDAYFKKADVVLWFEASPEFIATLPEPYRSALQQESNNATEPATAKGTFMEHWRPMAGAVIETSVFPNPVTAAGGATLSYTIDAQRRVAISLHDMFGRELASIDAGLRAPGTYTADIPIVGRESGVYLIVITTDNHERAVRRLLLQR